MREVRGVRGVARVIQATRGRSRRWRETWPRASARATRTVPVGTRKKTEEEAGWAAAGLHSNGLHREVSAR